MNLPGELVAVIRENGHRIEGLTPTGRATVAALQFNHSRR
jgi:hypothetical protein